MLYSTFIWFLWEKSFVAEDTKIFSEKNVEVHAVPEKPARREVQVNDEGKAHAGPDFVAIFFNFFVLLLQGIVVYLLKFVSRVNFSMQRVSVIASFIG